MQRSQVEQWEDEGGQNDSGRTKVGLRTPREEWLSPTSSVITLLPRFEHKEAADDDTGLPEHPIYSNYSKYLWKAHRRSGGVEIGGLTGGNRS